MNQRFDEDRAELESHFAERIQVSYIELAERDTELTELRSLREGRSFLAIRKQWPRSYSGGESRCEITFEKSGRASAGRLLACDRLWLLSQLMGWLLDRRSSTSGRSCLPRVGSPALIFLNSQLYASLVSTLRR